MQPGPATAVEWINAASTVVVAVATVVLAVATFLALRRERRREERRREAVDAQIRATGYEALLEVLEAFNLPAWTEDASVASMLQSARLLQEDLADIVDLARQMVMDAPEASPEVARDAERVFALAARTKNNLDPMANTVPRRDQVDPLPDKCREILEETDRQLGELLTLLDQGFGKTFDAPEQTPPAA